jgi:hypothetical protein
VSISGRTRSVALAVTPQTIANRSAGFARWFRQFAAEVKGTGIRNRGERRNLASLTEVLR